MAKHRRREQEPMRNNNTNNANNVVNNNPFGIDPMQLMSLLGGNFDMNSMLQSMNTNGFNLANLEPLAKMAGINLGNNGMFNNMNQGQCMNQNNNMNGAMKGNMNGTMNENMNNGFNSDINTNDNISDDIMSVKNEDNNQAFEMENIDNQKNDKGKKSSSRKENSKKQDKVNMDDNLKFLISLKTYIHPDRVKLIDKMIELYNKGIFKEI